MTESKTKSYRSGGNSCCFPNCSSNSIKDKITLFMPTNLKGEFYAKWNKAVYDVILRYRVNDSNFKKLREKKRIFICEKHYKTDDIEFTKTGRKTLKLLAIPTLNLPVKSHERKQRSRKPPKERKFIAKKDKLRRNGSKEKLSVIIYEGTIFKFPPSQSGLLGIEDKSFQQLLLLKPAKTICSRPVKEELPQKQEVEESRYQISLRSSVIERWNKCRKQLSKTHDEFALMLLDLYDEGGVQPQVPRQGCTSSSNGERTIKDSTPKECHLAHHISWVSEDRLSSLLCCTGVTLSVPHTPTNPLPSDKPFSCGHCGRRFKQRVGVRQHSNGNRKWRKFQKVFPCTICDKRFSFPCQLRMHKVEHKEKKEDFKKEKKDELNCTKCGKQFTNRGTLSTHILFAHRLTSHICQRTSSSTLHT